MRSSPDSTLAAIRRFGSLTLGALLATSSVCAAQDAVSTGASLGGPSSVGGAFAQASGPRPWHPDPEKLTLGFDYSVFGQTASEGPGVTEAAGVGGADYEAMSRAELVALAKERGIRANGKTVDIIKGLQELGAPGAAAPAPEEKDFRLSSIMG